MAIQRPDALAKGSAGGVGDCKEELEALHWCSVFKLTDLPSDGGKKARLVAQGFSQVEGIDLMSYSLP